jgi:hypothetical protein
LMNSRASHEADDPALPSYAPSHADSHPLRILASPRYTCIQAPPPLLSLTYAWMLAAPRAPMWPARLST